MTTFFIETENNDADLVKTSSLWKNDFVIWWRLESKRAERKEPENPGPDKSWMKWVLFQKSG